MLLVAILVDNLAVVFEVVGGFSASMISYGLPGSLYLIMAHHTPDANRSVESELGRRRNTIGAVLMVLVSVINFIFVIAKQFVAAEDKGLEGAT